MKKQLTFLLLITLSLISCNSSSEKIENLQKQIDEQNAELEKQKEELNNKLLESQETIETISSVDMNSESYKKNRIEDIKRWFYDLQSFKMRNCKNKTLVSFDQLGSDSEPMEFENTLKTCNPKDDFQIIEANLNGYEWMEEVNLYKKNNKLFFIFITGGAEGYSYERRYYLNENEALIQEYEKEAENGEEIKGPNKIVKSNLGKDIHRVLSDEFRRINEINKNGR